MGMIWEGEIVTHSNATRMAYQKIMANDYDTWAYTGSDDPFFRRIYDMVTGDTVVSATIVDDHVDMFVRDRYGKTWQTDPKTYGVVPINELWFALSPLKDVFPDLVPADMIPEDTRRFIPKGE